MSLSVQMALATLLGVVVGLFFGEYCSIFGPWGNAYIMLLKVTTIPFLVGAIIHGVGQLTGATVQQILKKGFIFIAIAWIINLGMIYLINFSFPHTKKMAPQGHFLSGGSQIDFAQLLIPENIFYSLSNNIIPSVVIFSLLLGLALMHIREKAAFMSAIESMVTALTRITAWIARITPLGTFLIIAYQAGTIQLSTVQQVASYLILYILGMTLIVFWVFPTLINALTPLSAAYWLKAMTPILLLAYTTNAVIVCLPFIMELVNRETHLHYPRDEKVQSPIQGIVSVVFNIPLGSLFIIAFLLFCSIFYQVPFGFINQIELVSTGFLTGLGSVGLGSWVNNIGFLLDSLGIPPDAINLYLTTLPFTAGFQSMVSAMEIASIAFLITLAYRNLISWKWKRVVPSIVTSIGPLLLVFLVFKWWIPLPKIQSNMKSICDFDISTPVQITFQENHRTKRSDEPLSRILQDKKLRVGYNSDVPPFCFINSHGNIAGYDMAFATKLAEDLGCDLELVPLNYATLAEDLRNGVFDIAMSAVSLTVDRLKTTCFTAPYIEAKIVYIVHEKLRKKLSAPYSVQRDPDTHVAVLKGSSFEKLGNQLFPNKHLILLDSYNDFATIDAKAVLLWEEQEAISWILLNPHFQIVFPTPALGIDILSYPIRSDADGFHCFLQQWLKLKKSEGFTDQQYDLWILKKTDIMDVPEPRWSVIQDVFHWVK